MKISELLLPEFDEEMANTRKVLERIPNDKLEWRSTPKSNTIGWVASHLANIPTWTGFTLAEDSFDVAPKGGEPYRTKILASREEILREFDVNVPAARAALAKATDEEFFQSWSLLQGGQALFTMPRYTVIRSFVLNHTVHHRAYLLSYLRQLGVPVPGMYGPSGDE